jgi:hypothetical protein
MTTEQQITQLLEAHRRGNVKQKDFENSIYQIINQHTQQQLYNALGNEAISFIRESFRKMFTHFLTVPNIELDTITREDLDESGDLVWVGKAQYLEDHLNENWVYRYFNRYPKTYPPTYRVNRQKYALRMAYQSAQQAYEYYITRRYEEDKAKREMAIKQRDEVDKEKEKIDQEQKENIK